MGEDTREPLPDNVAAVVVRAFGASASPEERRVAGKRLARWLDDRRLIGPLRRDLYTALIAGKHDLVVRVLFDLAGPVAAASLLRTHRAANDDPHAALVEVLERTPSPPTTQRSRPTPAPRPTAIAPRLDRVTRERDPVQRPVPPPPPAPPLIARRTVVSVGIPRQIDRRSAHAPSLDEIQRHVVGATDQQRRIVALPDLVPDEVDTDRWRVEIRRGDWVCPWPACAHPELVLKAGEVRRTHVAHRERYSHGRDVEWVLSTLAALGDVLDVPVRAVAARPAVVRAEDLHIALVGRPPGKALVDEIDAARAHVPQDARTALVLRVARLPLTATPVRLHEDPRVRWGFDLSPTVADALARFDRVLLAPEPGADDPGDPRFERSWVGLGLETRPERSVLRWDRVSQRPAGVAVPLPREQLARALSFAVRVLAPQDQGHPADRPSPTPHDRPGRSVVDVPAPGVEMEPVAFEEAGPVIRCRRCRFTQTIGDGISADEAEEIIFRVDDEDERSAELESHDVHYCVYDSCPRCGNGIEHH